MADLTPYIVLAVVIAPPILRQSQRLLASARSRRQAARSQSPPPALLSKARLAPFATPFSAVVTLVTLSLTLISLANLVPVQYGLDIFIPASAVHNLRKSIYTLYTAPSIYPASSHDDLDRPPFHIEALRGGYKPDLFLAHNAPITIPTTALRGLIESAPSLLPIGYHTLAKQQELQALVARLSSYEARRIYLLLGPKPLLDCTFCTTANDFFWYAVPFLLGIYAWRILAIGLITANPDDSIAVAIRQAASIVSRPSYPSQDGPASKHDADRSKWRTPAVSLLLAFMALELLVMYEFGQLTPDSARLNHWHSNLHIARQLVFLVVVAVVYLFPAPRSLDPFQQTMIHLDASQQSLQNILHLTEITDATRSVVLDDDRLLRLSQQWKHDNSPFSTHAAAQVVRAAEAQGGDAARDALVQAQHSIGRVTQLWWRNADQLNSPLQQPANRPAHANPSAAPSANGKL